MRLQSLVAAALLSTVSAAPWLGSFSKYKLVIADTLNSINTIRSGGPIFVNNDCSFNDQGVLANTYGTPNCAVSQIPGLQCRVATFVSPSVSKSNSIYGTLIAQTVNGLGFVTSGVGCATQLQNMTLGTVQTALNNASSQFQNAPNRIPFAMTNSGPNNLALSTNQYDVVDIISLDLPINADVTVTNYIPGKKIIVNVYSTGTVQILHLNFIGVDASDLLINVAAATTLQLNPQTANLAASFLAPLATTFFSSPSVTEVQGQLATQSLGSGIPLGVSNNNYFEFDTSYFNATTPNVDCATRFVPSANSFLDFKNGTTLFARYVMPAVNTTIQYLPYGGDPLGSIRIVSRMTFDSAPMNNYTAPVLNLNFTLINHGPKLSGDPTPFFFAQVRANWEYFELVPSSSYIVNPFDNSAFLLRTTTSRNPKYLQIGSGANGVGQVDYSLAYGFDYAFPFTARYFYAGYMSMKLSSLCNCTNTVNVTNFGLGLNDYVFNFPAKFSRDPIKAFNFLPDGLTLSGFNKGPYNSTNIGGQVMRLTGYLKPQNITTGARVFVDFWLQGQADIFQSQCPASYNPFGVPLYGLQFYKLIHSTMDVFNATTGKALYDVMLQDTTFIDPYSCPFNAQGPLAQVGLGANTLNSNFGIFIPAMYRQRTTTSWREVKATGTLTNSASTCSIQPL